LDPEVVQFARKQFVSGYGFSHIAASQEVGWALAPQRLKAVIGQAPYGGLKVPP
jgi:hypothetical protein